MAHYIKRSKLDEERIGRGMVGGDGVTCAKKKTVWHRLLFKQLHNRLENYNKT